MSFSDILKHSMRMGGDYFHFSSPPFYIARDTTTLARYNLSVSLFIYNFERLA